MFRLTSNANHDARKVIESQGKQANFWELQGFTMFFLLSFYRTRWERISGVLITGIGFQ